MSKKLEKILFSEKVESVTISFRTEAKTKEKLNFIGEKTKRSKSKILNDIIEDFVNEAYEYLQKQESAENRQ